MKYQDKGQNEKRPNPNKILILNIIKNEKTTRGLINNNKRHPRKSLHSGSFSMISKIQKIITSLNSPDGDSLPIINFDINGVKINAFCDSGVAVRLASHTLLNALKMLVLRQNI